MSNWIISGGGTGFPAQCINARQTAKEERLLGRRECVKREKSHLHWLLAGLKERTEVPYFYDPIRLAAKGAT